MVSVDVLPVSLLPQDLLCAILTLGPRKGQPWTEDHLKGWFWAVKIPSQRTVKNAKDNKGLSEVKCGTRRHPARLLLFSPGNGISDWKGKGKCGGRITGLK
jgi:hypothetical protein